MRYALMVEPQQGFAYESILAVARTAEEAGMAAFFRSDHYGAYPEGRDLPTTDAWATLAGLARETRAIRLGVLVSPVTFRTPGSLAKVIETVNRMSGGRVEAGFGVGWNKTEHDALALPFPAIGERYGRLEAQMQLFASLWGTPDDVSQPGRPHVILGGHGRERMARLVARYADEFNLTSRSIQQLEAAYERIRGACADVGRDADSVVYSAMLGVVVAETETELRERVGVLFDSMGKPSDGIDAWLERRRDRWLVGTPDQVLERVRGLEARGVERLILQDFLWHDLDHVRLLARTVGASPEAHG